MKTFLINYVVLFLQRALIFIFSFQCLNDSVGQHFKSTSTLEGKTRRWRITSASSSLMRASGWSRHASVSKWRTILLALQGFKIDSFYSCIYLRDFFRCHVFGKDKAKTWGFSKCIPHNRCDIRSLEWWEPFNEYKVSHTGTSRRWQIHQNWGRCRSSWRDDPWGTSGQEEAAPGDQQQSEGH